jgi:phosphatidate cytidylyltransferase
MAALSPSGGVVKVAAAKERKAVHEVRDRVVSGLVMLAMLVSLVFAGGWVMYLAASLLVAVSLSELYGVLAIRGIRAFAPGGILIGLIFLTSGQLSSQHVGGSAPLILGALLIAALAILVLPRFTSYKRIDLLLTLAGALYVGLLGSFALLIRAFTGSGYDPANASNFSGPALLLRASPQYVGFAWLLLVLGSVSAADIGAYAVGSLFGKHKLAPRISPKKTWEGLGGGVASCLLVAGSLGSLFGLLTWPWAVLLALALSACDILGDLAASAIKRYAGVKNYGNLIPGHGGVMDRIDGHLVALPVAYAIIRLIAGA